MKGGQAVNRNRAYWSKMGNDPDDKPSAMACRRKEHKKLLIKMIKQYPKEGFNEIVTLLREIRKESE